MLSSRQEKGEKVPVMNVLTLDRNKERKIACPTGLLPAKKTIPHNDNYPVCRYGDYWGEGHRKNELAKAGICCFQEEQKVFFFLNLAIFGGASPNTSYVFDSATCCSEGEVDVEIRGRSCTYEDGRIKHQQMLPVPVGKARSTATKCCWAKQSKNLKVHMSELEPAFQFDLDIPVDKYSVRLVVTGAKIYGNRIEVDIKKATYIPITDQLSRIVWVNDVLKFFYGHEWTKGPKVEVQQTYLPASRVFLEPQAKVDSNSNLKLLIEVTGSGLLGRLLEKKFFDVPDDLQPIVAQFIRDAAVC